MNWTFSEQKHRGWYAVPSRPSSQPRSWARKAGSPAPTQRTRVCQGEEVIGRLKRWLCLPPSPGLLFPWIGNLGSLADYWNSPSPETNFLKNLGCGTKYFKGKGTRVSNHFCLTEQIRSRKGSEGADFHKAALFLFNLYKSKKKKPLQEIFGWETTVDWDVPTSAILPAAGQPTPLLPFEDVAPFA